MTALPKALEEALEQVLYDVPIKDHDRCENILTRAWPLILAEIGGDPALVADLSTRLEAALRERDEAREALAGSDFSAVAAHALGRLEGFREGAGTPEAAPGEATVRFNAAINRARLDLQDATISAQHKLAAAQQETIDHLRAERDQLRAAAAQAMVVLGRYAPAILAVPETARPGAGLDDLLTATGMAIRRAPDEHRQYVGGRVNALGARGWTGLADLLETLGHELRTAGLAERVDAALRVPLPAELPADSEGGEP